jgi:hypothetical protein
VTGITGRRVVLWHIHLSKNTMSSAQVKNARSLNEAFCTLAERRRYEVWFLRLGLADGSGAWWFRYLLTNPGRGGCTTTMQELPVQVWATWFPAGDRPNTYIQGFPVSALKISPKNESPFHFKVADNEIGENFCRGALRSEGHKIAWNLQYLSTFRVTLSNKGWIGFSRTPHSDAVFSGEITLDGHTFSGNPLGFGAQGHNCGYRHRNFWRWTHAYFPSEEQRATTLEALVYEMPFGLVFRKAVLWHHGREHVFRSLREICADAKSMQWNFAAVSRAGLRLNAAIDGRGASTHRLPYAKTNCSGTFEVANNSLASASILLEQESGVTEQLETRTGAVLEIVG